MAITNGHPGIILNGLKGAEAIIYNVLYYTNDCLSTYEIANITCYHPNTVQAALRRLEEYALIQRHRHCNGQKYTYSIVR